MRTNKRKDFHGQWCKEWAIIAVIAALWITPVTRGYFISLLDSDLFKSALAFAFLAVLGRKMQVWAWESGFDDGNDAIPDKCLYDSGDGNGAAFRAFMPGVIRASWCTPISRLFGMSKRRVGILLPDGSVSFPVWPVASISAPGKAGNWMPVPENWCVTAQQAAKMQLKRDGIKRKARNSWSSNEQDYMSFTDLIFGQNATIMIDGGDELIACSVECTCGKFEEERLVRLERLQQEHAQRIIRDFVQVFNQQKELLDIGSRLAEWEKKRPVALARIRTRVSALEDVVEKYTAPTA